MANKFYAVKKGSTPGIYTDWEQCKAQVHGYSGAEYKSFPTAEAARQYMEGSFDSVPASTSDTCTVSSDVSAQADRKPQSDATHAVAYVDGSYHSGKHLFSYGAVIFWNGEEFHLSKMIEDTQLAAMHNVAGEIHGAMAAMAFALEHNCEALTIYHDYAGIAHWPLGQWKANKTGTQNYVAYYNAIRDRLTVTFIKVKGHSNDYYNDLADRLAKEALGI